MGSVWNGHDTVFKDNYSSNQVTILVIEVRENIEGSSVTKNSEEMAQELRVPAGFPEDPS